jgi:hypothetical protein
MQAAFAISRKVRKFLPKKRLPWPFLPRGATLGEDLN